MIMGGPVIFTGEKPQKCMTDNFCKEAEKLFTYYSCKTCSSDWICETCSKSCHENQGHETLLYMSDHMATEAICDCVKKKLCKL